MSDMNGIALKPAYGRRYKSALEAKTDFHKGLDFIIDAMFHPYDGRYASVRDCKAGDRVRLRYVNKHGYVQYADVTVTK